MSAEEKERIRELQILINSLNIRTHLFANTVSNFTPVTAYLPYDREKVVHALVLESLRRVLFYVHAFEKQFVQEQLDKSSKELTSAIVNEFIDYIMVLVIINAPFAGEYEEMFQERLKQKHSEKEKTA